MTKEVEAFRQYKETIVKIDRKAREAREEARTIFREQLRTLRETVHEELRAIRVLEQKTKRARRNNGHK